MARDRRRRASRLPTLLLLCCLLLLLLPSFLSSTSSAAAAATTTPAEEEDYSHFAELLATVMVLREGGVEEAMDAVPALHDVTHATIVALVSLAEAAEAEEEAARRRSGGSSSASGSSSSSSPSSPAFSAAAAFDPASWPGLTAAQASALASNYSKSSAAATKAPLTAATLAASAAELKRAVASGGGVNKSADPLYLAGERLGAELDPALERKAAGLPAPLGAKLRGVTQGLTALGTSLEAKANATAEDAQTEAFLRDVNAKLASFNVELSSKGSSVAREPRRFANAAAVIQRAITGTALSVRGVNFAPCLVSA